jgi:ribosome maturation factor RimP
MPSAKPIGGPPADEGVAGGGGGSPAGGGRTAAHTREHLLEILTPVVTGAGYDLEDVTVTAAGRRSLIRVSVDADGGIDLDAVAVVSRAISDRLDAEDSGGAAFSGPYVLEVSSPGVDRPLTEQRHWRRAVGRLVSVHIADPDGGASVTGRVLAAEGPGVVLDVDGSRREVAWADLGRGKVQVEFNRAQQGED